MFYKHVNREDPIYGVNMPDGDQYVLAAVSSYDAAAIATQVYSTKVRILQSIYKDIYRRDYDNFLETYGHLLANTKSVRMLKDYNKDNFKKANASSVLINDKDENKDKPVKIIM